MPRAPKPKKPTTASDLATLRAVEAQHPKKTKKAAAKPPPTRSPTPPGRSPSYSPPPRAAGFAGRAEYLEAYDAWERMNPGHREGGADDEFAPSNTQI